jgi:predicted dehydrogenase
MKRRDFVRNTAALASIAFLPSSVWAMAKNGRLRTAHIGLGAMGKEDLTAISSHELVDVVALCDVDSKNLAAAQKLHPKAKIFSDYRAMLNEMKNDIDAVIVSTPDHTHAPASMMAMEMDKPVYCQKPLTHHVSEARKMDQLAKEKNLVTQMGIQVHSFYDYRLATLLIQSGIIGKVSTVRAWSNKNWGYDGPTPQGSDPVPETLDWNLWLGTSAERPYKKGFYHPSNWRKLLDYGCGTLGDMGVHIFDTPYNALALDVPKTITNICRNPSGFGFPENNLVTYEFPGTKYTTETLTWVWYDGPGAPSMHTDFSLPNMERLPEQGAMFMGEKGKLLLPHFMELPRLIVDGKYKNMEEEIAKISADNDLVKPTSRNYGKESAKHYHQFVDTILEKDKCTAPFSYSARLTEVILLGVIAGRFPNKTLHWDSESAQFSEAEANQFLDSPYREF